MSACRLVENSMMEEALQPRHRHLHHDTSFSFTVFRGHHKTVRVREYLRSEGISEIVRKRRVHRLGAIGIVFAVSVLSVAAGLLPLAAIAAIAIALIIARQIWKQGNIGAKPFIEQYESVLNIYRESETEFDRSSAPPAR
jgi:hypothetical protein